MDPATSGAEGGEAAGYHAGPGPLREHRGRHDEAGADGHLLLRLGGGQDAGALFRRRISHCLCVKLDEQILMANCG